MEDEEFTLRWNEKFPQITKPPSRFTSLEHAEDALENQRTVTSQLQEKLKQHLFYLNYLENMVTSHRRLSSSNDVTVATTTTTNDVTTSGGSVQRRTQEKIEEKITTQQQQQNEEKTKKQETQQEDNINKRKSKVLENVKLFESKRQPHDTTGGGGIQRQSSSIRRRTSYLEMWECKTGGGGGDKVDPPTPLSRHTSVIEDDVTSSCTADVMTSSSTRPHRSDYVQVWECDSGQQRGGDGYDSQDAFLHRDYESREDYDVNDIDMNDGYGKRHYTIGGGNIRLLEDKKIRDHKRMTWPTKPQQDLSDVDDEEMEERFSRTDLTDDEDEDDDYSDDDVSDDSSSHTSNQSTRLQSASESPYHDMRRARTTNERLGAAISNLWIPSISPVRTSIISIQSSLDIQSSDDDILLDDRTSIQSGEISENSPAVSRRLATSSVDTSLVKQQDNNQQQQQQVVSKQPPPLPIKQATNRMTNRQSALASSFKNENVSGMVDYQKVRNIEEAEKLRMRHYVLTSILDMEVEYIHYLNTLQLYMKPIYATIGTSQPVISLQDYEVIFFRITDLMELHKEFCNKLRPRLDNWSSETQVADIFDFLLSKLSLYKDYLRNYQKAIHTIDKCSKDNTQFSALTAELKVQSQDPMKGSESITLKKMMYKPAERIMRTTLALQDLLKHTPHRHPDYQLIRKMLKHSQTFLEKVQHTMPSSYKPRRIAPQVAAKARNADRHLIKDGYLVEVSSDGQRKLRYCFLYTDLLLCAKEKNNAGMFHHLPKVSYECKWYIQLADLSFEPFKDSDQLPEYRQVADQDLRDFSQQAQQIKLDIMKERKRHKSSSRHQVPSRREERLRKKLSDYNTRIVLLAPNLPLKLYHECGKSYLFLMSSDYERIEWHETIMKQQESCFKSFPLTTVEISTLLNETNQLRPKKMAMSGLMLGTEDELLSGYLTVTIHSAKGFLTKCNPYCCLEVDSFGQFQTKAKTRNCVDTSTPHWEEEFELEVDGAQQLRILIFEKANTENCVLIAKTKIALNKDVLGKNGQWNHKRFEFNGIGMECSFIFVPREHSLQRLPSKAANGVFGVKIEQVGKRDMSGIPSIVRKLIEEVERRGMDEVGIYRVSGVVSGIKALKLAFDNNRKDVGQIMCDVDINAVAGVLKLYFRELPEPLFTNTRYKDFVEASSLTDQEIKLATFKKLIADLPVTNYKTLYFLRQHLIKVSRNEEVNKMNLQNIATVFGPTLLRPSGADPTDPNQLQNLRLDVHFQMDVLLFVLEHLDMQPYEQLRASRNQQNIYQHQQRYRPYEEIVINQTSMNPTIVTSQTSMNPTIVTQHK